MLGSILGFLTGLGPIIGNLGGRYLDLQKAKEQTKSNEKLAEINAEITAIQDRRAVLIAEAGSRLAGGINASVRLLLALAIASPLIKMMAWDRTIGSFMGCAGRLGGSLDKCTTFRTDAMSDIEIYAVTAVLMFYFLTSRFKKNG